MIRGDIATYRQRVEDAKQKLDDLQHRLISRKKKRDQQRALDNEIRHVKKMITYAEDALALMKNN